MSMNLHLSNFYILQFTLLDAMGWEIGRMRIMIILILKLGNVVIAHILVELMKGVVMMIIGSALVIFCVDKIAVPLTSIIGLTAAMTQKVCKYSGGNSHLDKALFM